MISGVDGEKCSIAGETETPTDLLIEQLQYHQLIPLVYYYRQQLQAAGWDFDQSTIELLRSHTFSNISRIMIVEHFLQHLDGLFKANAVEYRIFKGIVTAKSVYQEDYLRSFGDLDILVRADQPRICTVIFQTKSFRNTHLPSTLTESNRIMSRWMFIST